MKKMALVLCGLLSVCASRTRSQTTAVESRPAATLAQQSPTFFPRNWVRGYMDFAVAPSHNEPDLGRCAFPQPVNAGGSASGCTAYARYLFSGYLELQPLGRTLARHFFFFIEPKLSFGRNIPQVRYAASMEPIAWDRCLGLGFQLPRNFELRTTQHRVDYLGRYGRPLGPADLHTTGPYGLYTTISVRWSFGGYGHKGAPPVY